MYKNSKLRIVIQCHILIMNYYFFMQCHLYIQLNCRFCEGKDILFAIVKIFTHTHTHTHTYIYIYTHSHTHTHTHTYTHTHTHTHTHTNAHTHTHTHTHTHIYIHTHTHTHTHIHTHTHMHPHPHIYIHTQEAQAAQTLQLWRSLLPSILVPARIDIVIYIVNLQSNYEPTGTFDYSVHILGNPVYDGCSQALMNHYLLQCPSPVVQHWYFLIIT